MLDIGCGCGGLGLALREKFGVKDYLGIEINPQAVEQARLMNPLARFQCEDVLHTDADQIGLFDIVFSLSCIDWNIELREMLHKCWDLVSDKGSLILSLRLTDKKSILDISSSYQEISFDGSESIEVAQYSILNIDDCLSLLSSLPSELEIYAYAYNGAPSQTAVTPYEELCFAVFSLTKDTNSSFSTPRFRLELPLK